MRDGRTHPLLAQLPLTVSPFIQLPKTATLPYTYKSLPSSLPPSAVGEQDTNPKPRFVVSGSGHAAHPDEIIASCHALQAHLHKRREDAEAALKKWQDDIRARDLAEKRRIAPGYLDRDEKILQPTRKGEAGKQPENIMDIQEEGPSGKGLVEQQADAGAELDRAFGGMGLK